MFNNQLSWAKALLCSTGPFPVVDPATGQSWDEVHRGPSRGALAVVLIRICAVVSHYKGSQLLLTISGGWALMGSFLEVPVGQMDWTWPALSLDAPLYQKELGPGASQFLGPVLFHGSLSG